MTDTTNEDFNSEQRRTYRNVSYEAVAYMSDLGEPSVENEYIERLNGIYKENDLQRVYALLNKANLPETQKRRLIKHIYHRKSTRSIAKEEGVTQSTVMNRQATDR